MRRATGWLRWRALLNGLLVLTVSSGMVPPVGATPTPPPAPGPDLMAIRLQVQLRLADGRPAPGVLVALTPADPSWGGPPAGTLAQQGTTGENGSAVFTRLGAWIWRARFAGVVAEQPIQPVEMQGRAPFGTTGGDGFVVRVQVQEEHAALGAEGSPITAPIQVAAFVLVAAGEEWAPTLDLAEPGEPPQPLAAGAHTGVSVSATPAARDQAAPAGVTGGEQGTPWDLLPLLWLLPIFAAGGALLTRWRQRRAEQTPVPPPADDDMDWLAQDTGGDDRA